MNQLGRPGRRGRRRACIAFAGVVAALAAGSCIVGDDRCGRNQVMFAGSSTRCECAPGAILDPKGDGCTPCPVHERPVNQACECELGYVRPSPGASCEEAVGSTAGEACDEANPCFDPNPYCVPGEGGGFCTTAGCTSKTQCPTEWRCKTSGATSFCARPTGLRDPCQRQEDCAGKEASLCETTVTNTCFVAGCAEGLSTCPNGFVCCDVRAVIGISVCVASSVLVGGLCPTGIAPLPEGT